MAHLPIEVIEYIFKYLTSVEDLKAASQVCKRWREAYSTYQFHDKETFLFQSEKQILTFLETGNISLKYCSVALYDVVLTDTSTRFWKKFGCKIKSLYLFTCHMHENIFMYAMRHCSNLETIYFIDCHELFRTGLALDIRTNRDLLRSSWRKVTTFKIIENDYLTDHILMNFASFLPNLTRFSVVNCKVNCHPGVIRRFYPKGFTAPSDNVLTSLSIQLMITNPKSKISDIELSECLIDNLVLKMMAQTSKMKWIMLNLESCRELTDVGISDLCNAQNKLRLLHLSECTQLTDRALIKICSSLSLLYGLSIAGCRHITDQGAVHLRNLKYLGSLDISGCEKVGDVGLIRGLCNRSRANFSELRMDNLPNVTETAVVALALSLPQLLILCMDNCSEAVTDLAIQTIFYSCTKLKILSMSKSYKISDAGITGSKSFSNLMPDCVDKINHILQSEEDYYVECEVAPVDFEATNGKCPKLLDLQAIRSLDLSYCRNITDISLEKGIKAIELKELFLNNCPRITSKGIIYLVHNNPSIQDLYLDSCGNIRDSAVEAIFQWLKRIRFLSLSYNPLLTGGILNTIAYKGNRLRCLSLTGCPLIDTDNIRLLKRYLPRLGVLDYTGSDEESER